MTMRLVVPMLVGAATAVGSPAAAPEPKVSLSIEAASAHETWTMRVTNEGDVPVRLVADARLLSLYVTPRGTRKAVRCDLPADMRPADPEERALVLPPKRTYAESFEPRLYCFGGARDDALAQPGAIVVAHLGFASDARAKAPWVIAPLDGVEPAVLPMKAIEAPPIAIADDPTPAPVPVMAEHEGGIPVRLVVSSSRAVDAGTRGEIAVTVTLRNEGSEPVTTRFRPETLSFDTVGPNGVERCAWPVNPGAPTRDQFTTLAPKGATSLTVMLSAYCSGHAFDQAGLFVARPRLDTRAASGESIGLRTFDGEVIAAAPTIVRLHRGSAPARLVRPRLQPAPAPAGVAAPTSSAKPSRSSGSVDPSSKR